MLTFFLVLAVSFLLLFLTYSLHILSILAQDKEVYKIPKEYINEYTKFLVYTWLPKLNYDTKSGIKMSISDKSTPLTDTDETITLIISMPDGTKYEAFLRTKIDKKTHKFQILNILVEGIDLVLSYRAQFVGYMEQNKNDPRSIIQYLKQQNQIKKQNADFVIPEEFINNK